MNHVAEVCAELAMYHVMIGIDEILDHYHSEASICSNGRSSFGDF